MSEQWTDEARARLESYMADDPDTFAFPEDLRAALDEIGRLETKLAAANELIAEERKALRDPASYSSMVYWREKCYEARAEVERLRGALRALLRDVDARLSLDSGFKGMGHNIAVESAGKLRVDAEYARRVLRDLSGEEEDSIAGVGSGSEPPPPTDGNGVPGVAPESPALRGEGEVRPKPGDWVRFRRGGVLVIGVVQYVRRHRTTNAEWDVSTDVGEVWDSSIEEIRPEVLEGEKS